MRAGQLRDTISVERQAAGRDDWGEATGWEPAGTFRANVATTSATEGPAPEGTAARTRYTIKLRHTAAAAGIAPADRITHRGTVIDITGITPNDRRTEIEISGVNHRG